MVHYVQPIPQGLVSRYVAEMLQANLKEKEKYSYYLLLSDPELTPIDCLDSMPSLVVIYSDRLPKMHEVESYLEANPERWESFRELVRKISAAREVPVEHAG